MPRFTVYATQTKNYQIEVEAEDETSAIASLDEWIEDDFEDFEVTGGWEMVAK
jgi:phosphotransferase system HPr-like phosphotransfer protein